MSEQSVMVPVNGAVSRFEGFDTGKVELIKRTVAVGATNDELELFLHQCHKTGLDPLARQIYFIKRQGKGTIQTGIDGYRLVADRSGRYAGNDDPIYDGEEGGHPLSAKVVVWKMVDGQRCAFSATARWDEYAGDGNQGFMWKKMPYLMLGKVAEALALRKAFPAELSGLYTHDEMIQAGRADSGRVNVDTGEIVDEAAQGEFYEEPARVIEPAKPASAGDRKKVFDRILELWREAMANDLVKEYAIPPCPFDASKDDAIAYGKGLKAILDAFQKGGDIELVDGLVDALTAITARYKN